MRNPIIKNYFKNKPILDATNDVCNMMCTILIVANKLYPKVMYPKAMEQFVTDRIEYCSKSMEQVRDEVFDYNIVKEMAEIGIINTVCSKLVDKFMHPINREIKDVFIDNVYLIFAQLHNENGFGKKRIAKLIDALLSNETKPMNAIDIVQGMGVHIERATISDLDYKKYLRKNKVREESLKEQQDVADKLNAFRKYSEEVLK